MRGLSGGGGSLTGGLGNMKTPGGKMSHLGLAAGLLSGNAMAQLVAEDAWSLPVMFAVNPSGVSVTKSNKVEGNRSVVTTAAQDAVKASGNVRLNLSDAHLMGVGVTQLSANKLIEWATPVELPPGVGPEAVIANRLAVAKAAAAASAASSSKSITKATKKGKTEEPKIYQLPVLLFSWGLYGPRGSNIPVTLESVTVDYKRFDPFGLPIWAQIKLTLVEVYRPKTGTNPSSGGVSGRATHTMQQGENVVQIANRAYGTPQAWRAVAEANDLDDPLRIGPGRQLSLPPQDELDEPTR